MKKFSVEKAFSQKKLNVKKLSNKFSFSKFQLIGGYVSSKIGGNLIFGVGIGMTAILTLITPFAAKKNVYLLVAVRIIEGVFEGVTFPCIHAVW